MLLNSYDIIKKLNKKQKISMFKKVKNLISSGILSKKSLILTSLGVLIVGSTIFVSADQFTSQINSLQAQNAQNQATVNSLQLQSGSYQDAINNLQSQIAAIQAAIVASQNQQAQITQQIAANQIKLNQEKQVLADDIKTMYLNSQMSTIEELATSKSLSDFVDAQVYRTAVQNQVQTILNQVTTLEKQLESQKIQVGQLLQTQEAQQNQLNSSEQQQQQLLAYSQSQISQYNQQIAANQNKIIQLRAEQAALNERNASYITPPSGGYGGYCATPNYPIGGTYYYSGSMTYSPNGGYPMSWCNASMDSLTVAGGFPNRECTSFAYWYFTVVEGNSGFYVTGNANQWWYTANRPVDRTPAVGSIAVDPSGYYGHVMIVIATPGQTYDGRVVPAGYIDTISMNDDWYGHFFAMQRPYSGFYFIH